MRSAATSLNVLPAIVIVPRSGVNPADQIDERAFPAPFGPMTARISPSATVRSISDTAVTPPNDNVTPLSSRIGRGLGADESAPSLNRRVLNFAPPKTPSAVSAFAPIDFDIMRLRQAKLRPSP